MRYNTVLPRSRSITDWSVQGLHSCVHMASALGPNQTKPNQTALSAPSTRRRGSQTYHALDDDAFSFLTIVIIHRRILQGARNTLVGALVRPSATIAMEEAHQHIRKFVRFILSALLMGRHGGT